MVTHGGRIAGVSQFLPRNLPRSLRRDGPA
jgi:hypothetical protein